MVPKSKILVFETELHKDMFLKKDVSKWEGKLIEKTKN